MELVFIVIIKKWKKMYEKRVEGRETHNTISTKIYTFVTTLIDAELASFVAAATDECNSDTNMHTHKQNKLHTKNPLSKK